MFSPDNSDPEDYQVQGNTLGEDYLVLDTSASEYSINSREASTEQESEHSCVRLEEHSETDSGEMG